MTSAKAPAKANFPACRTNKNFLPKMSHNKSPMTDKIGKAIKNTQPYFGKKSIPIHATANPHIIAKIISCFFINLDYHNLPFWESMPLTNFTYNIWYYNDDSRRRFASKKSVCKNIIEIGDGV